MENNRGRVPVDTAWGKRSSWVHPRVTARVFKVFDVLNRYVHFFILFSVCLNLIMMVVISFGITLSRGYVADGTIYSCEISTLAPPIK